MEKRNNIDYILITLIGIVISLILSLIISIVYNEYDLKNNPARAEEYQEYLKDLERIKEERKKRNYLSYDEKNMDVYIEELTIQRNSNALKKDKYYITTDGKNADKIIYINKSLFYKLKEKIKEPSILNLKCQVRNGYLDGVFYEDYIVDIYDLN